MRFQNLLFLALVIGLAAGCSSSGQSSGTLIGHVDIGPLQPVERIGVPQPTPSPSMYAAWQIVILSEDGKREIARTEIDSKGDYQISIPVGKYMVTAKPISGGGLGGQQVQPMEIIKVKITHFDISIDTGIR
ncbi:MAG: hypothetical protein ABSG01_04915 [Anaerolineales bacterium]